MAERGRPKSNDPGKLVTFRLAESRFKDLQRRARKKKISLSKLIREALHQMYGGTDRWPDGNYY